VGMKCQKKLSWSYQDTYQKSDVEAEKIFLKKIFLYFLFYFLAGIRKTVLNPSILILLLIIISNDLYAILELHLQVFAARDIARGFLRHSCQ